MIYPDKMDDLYIVVRFDLVWLFCKRIGPLDQEPYTLVRWIKTAPFRDAGIITIG
jgi:hypothetical protein